MPGSAPTYKKECKRFDVVCVKFSKSAMERGLTELRSKQHPFVRSKTTIGPALQRLLADIAAGRVNTIVVYKIDRLTRSLRVSEMRAPLLGNHWFA
jgi:DNA invertase Pin-like site-specific DNA recombinase